MTERLFVGATATLTRTVTAEDVERFSVITGDRNPAHFDDEFARACQFRERVAHGLLVAGHISAVLGTVLPGPGSIYLKQSLSFRAPVYVGDTITATVTVVHVRSDKPIVTLETTCANPHGDRVVEGEAVILLRTRG